MNSPIPTQDTVDSMGEYLVTYLECKSAVVTAPSLRHAELQANTFVNRVRGDRLLRIDEILPPDPPTIEQETAA